MKIDIGDLISYTIRLRSEAGRIGRHRVVHYILHKSPVLYLWSHAWVSWLEVCDEYDIYEALSDIAIEFDDQGEFQKFRTMKAYAYTYRMHVFDTDSEVWTFKD